MQATCSHCVVTSEHHLMQFNGKGLITSSAVRTTMCSAAMLEALLASAHPLESYKPYQLCLVPLSSEGMKRYAGLHGLK